MRIWLHDDPKAKLTASQDALSGCIGGILSCWNHPFEVARIEMQARAAAGEAYLSMVGVFRLVVAEYGVKGLFQGIPSDGAQYLADALHGDRGAIY